MAPTVARCPGCGAKFRLKTENVAGKTLKCPKCERKFRIGASSAAKKRKRSRPKPEAAEDDFLAALDSAAEMEDEGAIDDFDDSLPDVPTRTSRRSSKKKQELPEPGFPWKITLIISGSVVGVVILGVVGWIMFQPPAAVSGGDGSSVVAPKNFDEIEFGDGDYLCEGPKDWKVTSGGGREGIPPWVQFEQGGASIRIRDSLAGTDEAMIDRALGFGTAVEQGTAPVDDVNQHRKKGVAESMRNYEEKAPEKLQHELGDALIAEFTAKPLFGEAIRGYHATVLDEFHQFTIVCRCPESLFETLKPAFKHVITKLERDIDEDALGL
jgi:hypothetical protein